jgi:RecA-family ATPase
MRAINLALGEDYKANGSGVGSEQPPAHEPLAFADLDAWARSEPPPREWSVPDRFPLRNVALLSGEGAIGKSVLEMQQGVAHVLARDWAGTLPEPGDFLYLNAEDEQNELHRRLDAIAAHYGASVADLVGHFHIIARAGQDAVLGYPDRRSGLVKPTRLFGELMDAARDIKPKTIALDTSADIFGGDEINRGQVRQFIGLLRMLAIAGNSAVVVCAHPSLTGINSGTGLSGSTAWHNSVRARAYFTKADEDGGTDTGLRKLQFMKSNYGPPAASITLQYKAGVYVPVGSASTFEKAAADAKADYVFLQLLRRYDEQGRDVGHKPSSSYAPALFVEEPEAKALKLRKSDVVAAMNRLFTTKKIKVVNRGRPSRPAYRIECVNQEEQST